jgi:uncharacterized damage-inducible protein DinB
MYTDLANYDVWADRQWIECLQEIDHPPADAVSLLSHLGVTKQVWLRRIRGESTSDLVFWPEELLGDAAARLKAAGVELRMFVEQLGASDLDRTASYRNSSGTAYETPVRDVLSHLFTHAHYHRGQIARAVREAGHEPVWTDFIVYARRRDAGDDSADAGQ